MAARSERLLQLIRRLAALAERTRRGMAWGNGVMLAGLLTAPLAFAGGSPEPTKQTEPPENLMG